MDEQNKSVGERWGRPAEPGERGYAGEAPDDRTREIRSDIEQTRAEMGETVDAIQDRLRPRNVVSRAAESVRDATVGRARELARRARHSSDPFAYQSGDGGFLDRLRENPIPAALAAGSLAWLAFATRSGKPRAMPAIYGSTRGGEAFIAETTISSEIDEPYGEEFYEAGVRGDWTPGSRRMSSMARGAGQRLRRAGRSTQNGLQRMLQDNPLAVAAIAAGIGATIGLALPETERENEMMGEARQSMVERAKGAANEAAGRVQEAAQAAQKVATEVVTRTGRDQT